MCGNRTLGDLKAAEGADAVGFVVASPGSRRSIPPRIAKSLVARVPPFVQSVLVTRETGPARLAALQGAVGAEALQVHGLRGAAEARAVRKAVQGRLVLAVGVRGAEALARARALEPHCDAVLLDTAGPSGQTGGTGKPHDWHLSARIARALDKPVVLAGGLTPENVAEAVSVVRPYAVDVSGGVEGPRGKSRARVRAFLEAVRRG